MAKNKTFSKLITLLLVSTLTILFMESSVFAQTSCIDTNTLAQDQTAKIEICELNDCNDYDIEITDMGHDAQIKSSYVSLMINHENIENVHKTDTIKLEEGEILTIEEVVVQNYAGGEKRVWFCINDKAGIIIEDNVEDLEEEIIIKGKVIPTITTTSSVRTQNLDNKNTIIDLETTPIVNEEEYQEITKCNGCEIEGECLSYGTRLLEEDKPMYCADDGSISNQQETLDSCQANHECESNNCVQGYCANIDSIEEELKDFSVFKKAYRLFKTYCTGDWGTCIAQAKQLLSE